MSESDIVSVPPVYIDLPLPQIGLIIRRTTITD
jgi:hypothetical protein